MSRRTVRCFAFFILFAGCVSKIPTQESDKFRLKFVGPTPTVAVDSSRRQALCLSFYLTATMNQAAYIHSNLSTPEGGHPIPSLLGAQSRHEERLPFSIRLVSNEEQLLKAVAIRHAAYARHMPVVAESLRVPEKADHEDGTHVLLAESKLDGSPLGTARIQTNKFKPLAIEKSVDLPDWLKGASMAQVSRLGIALGGIGRVVKIALIKASFQYCELNHIEWAILAARPPLDRQYAQLLFSDIFPDAGYIPLPHMDNVPHRVMGFEIASGPSRWNDATHPMRDFFCNTHHPDIDVTPQGSQARPYLVHPGTRNEAGISRHS